MSPQLNRSHEAPELRLSRKKLPSSTGNKLLQRIQNTVGSLSREARQEIQDFADKVPESIQHVLRSADFMHADLRALMMNEVFKLGRTSKRISHAALPLVAASFLSACGAAPNVAADFSESFKVYEQRLDDTERLLQSANAQLQRQQSEMTTLTAMISSLQQEGNVSKKTIDDVVKIMNEFKLEMSQNNASFQSVKTDVLQKLSAIEGLSLEQKKVFESALEMVSTAGLPQNQMPANMPEAMDEDLFGGDAYPDLPEDFEMDTYQESKKPTAPEIETSEEEETPEMDLSEEEETEKAS